MSQLGPIWTVPRVQSQAQAAVTLELYTLPFYLTALTSLTDTTSQIYVTILSVAMEEMLHMELAANLCLALGTTPNFTAPVYGTAIPYLDPDDPETGNHALINAVLGPLDQTRLDTMLDIETPEEFEQDTVNDTPQDVYGSIGAFYDALFQGIKSVGWDKFHGSTANQQAIFGSTNFPETIASLDDAQSAIATITEQGEGKRFPVAPLPPFTIVQFPVPPENRLADPSDPSEQNAYSHFGRFVNIQNSVDPTSFPQVYPGDDPYGPLETHQQDALNVLQKDFNILLDTLNGLWATGQGDWKQPMLDLMTDCVTCWQVSVIPLWSAPPPEVTRG